MVAAHDVCVNLWVAHMACDAGACQPVVNAPANVASAGVCPVRPPAVGAGRVGICSAKRIDKSRIQKCLKATPLFVGKSMLADIWFGICEVNFLMSDVEISAKQHRFRLLEPLHVRQERWIPPLVPQRQSAQIALGVWRVDGDDPKLIKFRCDDTPLICRVTVAVVCDGKLLGDIRRKSVDKSEGRDFRKDRRAAIPLFGSGIKMLVILRQIQLDLPALRFGFLEAEDVGIVRGDERLQSAFVENGADAIDVPGVEF